MRSLVFSTALAAAVIISAGAASVAAGQQDNVAAANGWVKMPSSGETMAEAFAEVKNPTMYDVYLTAAAADIGRVEFRDPSKGDAPEAQVVNHITIPAYGSLIMDEKGVHLVLVDLKGALKEGDTVPLTLTTDSGVVLKVPAVVRTP